MKKYIYAYFNQCDIDQISELLKSNNVIFYNKDKEEIETLPAIGGLPTIYLYVDGVEFGIFNPCFSSVNIMQCGMFSFEYDKDSSLKTIFNCIKKHFRKEFKISQDKSCYIGPGIYEDWINYKYCFPFPLSFESFFVSEDNIGSLFDEVIKNGYQIKNKNIKIKNADVIDLSADSLIIYDKEAKLITNIVKRKIIRHEYGSECIFVIKKEKKYEFILDKRIDCNSCEKIVNLFYLLKCYQVESND